MTWSQCDVCSKAGDAKILRDNSFNVPQPGYVGSRYKTGGVLLVGQNPGCCPESKRERDHIYADALKRVRDIPSLENYESLKDLLKEYIETWPVHSSYFPLEECGMSLSEIAYFNLVRCRTHDNAPPSRGMIKNCLDRHLTEWLDILRPRVVVCVGKWAYDQLAPRLRNGNIKIGFINRARHLNQRQREENRDEIVKLVCQGRQPNHIDRAIKAKGESSKMKEKTQVKERLAKKPIAQSSGILGQLQKNEVFYRRIFESLGFHDVQLRKTLKHDSGKMPSMYFNTNRDKHVYFTAYASDEHRFPNDLWCHIGS